MSIPTREQDVASFRPLLDRMDRAGEELCAVLTAMADRLDELALGQSMREFTADLRATAEDMNDYRGKIMELHLRIMEHYSRPAPVRVADDLKTPRSTFDDAIDELAGAEKSILQLPPRVDKPSRSVLRKIFGG